MITFNQVFQKLDVWIGDWLTYQYPGHYEIEEAKLMYNLLIELGSNAEVVELGCFYGRSSTVIGEASKIAGFHFTCVDAFVINGEDVENHFRKHILANYNCSLVKNTTNAAIKSWDKEIDYIFIDANHAPEGIEADCKNWLPFVKTEGIAQFHDYINWRYTHLPAIVDNYTKGWKEIGRKDSSVFKQKQWI